MNEVLRQEKKFLISIDQYYQYSHYFKNILSLDTHSHGDGYEIRSLYFDSLDDRDFQEKTFLEDETRGCKKTDCR